MSPNSKFYIAIFLFVSAFLLFISFPISAVESPLSTKVIVVEGKVVCFDYPKDKRDIILKEGAYVAEFSVRLTEATANSMLEGEIVSCYIPDEYRDTIGERLKPGVYVLLMKNNRRIHQTLYDIIAVGVEVYPGYEHISGRTKTEKAKTGTIIEKVREAGKAGVGPGAVMAGIGPGTKIGEEPGEESDGEPLINFPIPKQGQPILDENEQDKGGGDGADFPVIGQQFIDPPQDLDVASAGGGGTTPAPGELERYVDGDAGSDANGGTSWNDAWRTVTYALTQVQGTILYVRGTFTSAEEGGMPIDVDDEHNLKFVGVGGPTFTGEGTSQIFRVGNTTASTNLSFSNITFTNANNAGNGAAMLITNSSSVGLNNCTFTSNTSSAGSGGALSVVNTSTVTINGCTFGGTGAGNVSSTYGGAIHIESGGTVGITNDTKFISNRSGSGGAIYVTVGSVNINGGDLTEIHFSSNSATADGGAIYAVSPSSLSLNVLRFGRSSSGNFSARYGGAISIHSANFAATCEIKRCIFGDNGNTVAQDNGGAIEINQGSPTIENCLFYENDCKSATYGAAVYVTDSASQPTFTNCTFYNNTVDTDNYGNGIYLNSNVTDIDVTNCILYHTSGHVLAISADSARYDVSNSCLYSGVANDQCYRLAGAIEGWLTAATFSGWDEGGNIGNTVATDDPDFFNAGGASYTDYKIISDSPCIDTGTNTGAPDCDIRGSSYGRPNPPGGTCDMGCYEWHSGDDADPPITGRVYNSVTGETISSPTVAIFRENGSTYLSRTSSNPYTFNVDPGRYYIAVKKDGYGFPSQIAGGVTAGDHGDTFTAADSPLTIDIPVDPDGWLYIEKTANKKRATVGEVVTYNIKIENKNWYQAVSNVELADDIVNGFKYVSGSAYKGYSVQEDPVISGRKAVFTIGTVSANSTVNISYQARVGAGIPEGRYRSAAHTRNETTEERNSNITSCNVEVVEDPLFTRGTIIGKVFWDLNGNGAQDSGEGGVPSVNIYTEYGVAVETDSDGKYHLADVPAGNHLLKVDSSVLPDWVGFTTDNPYYVKITEGLLAKVNFGLTQSSVILSGAERSEGSRLRARDSSPSAQNDKIGVDDHFFIVALAEGTVRNLDTSGNIEMAGKDDRFDDGVHVDGRLALYLKGKVLGKFLITASADTERRPGGRYDTRKLFTNLDPDKYYPVYGDASKVDYAGVDTQDVVYVLIEWDNSFAKWGSFNTEMPLYNRSLSGGIVNYKSVGKTKFGDIRTELKGFGAFSRQKPAHDEFVGTGGSLYYLRHEDVIEGSEKVRVEVRDRVSKMTVNSLPLYEQKDYEIDYDSGRILLKKPLNSVQQMYNNTIISNDILMGERIYLVVDYEYYGGGMSNEAWGAKASQWIGNHIRVGGTYVQEQKEGDSATADRDYKLMGGDASVKLNKDTVVNAYYSRTEETQLGSSMSYDGGLTFSTQGENYSLGKSGSCVSVDGRTKLFGNTDIFLSYSRQDPYYSVTDSISSQGSHKYYATVVSKLTKHLSAGVSHITQKYFKGTVAEDVFGARGSHTTTGILDYRRGKWDLRAEYEHQEISDPLTSYTYFGTMPLLRNDFVAARVGYQLFSWLHAYMRGQGTVKGEANNQGTIGADINIGMYTTLNIAETVGNLGDSTLVGLTTRLTEGTDVYANLEVGNHMRLGKYTKTTYGQSSQISPDAKVYIEEDYSSYRENVVRGTVLGYHKKIKDTLGLGLTYERSNVKNNRLVIDRDSGSAALSYLDPDFMHGIKANAKVEIRNDRGPTEVRQWVTENDILWRVTEGLTLSGRGNWGWTEDRDRKTDEAEFYELGGGFSLRPVSWDKLNILGKYSYLTNLPPDSQIEFPETTESRRHVYAIEGVFDVFRYLQLVGKFAYRDMKEKVGYRDWTDSDTYLYIARTNFHLGKRGTVPSGTVPFFLLRGWDLGVEYRVLSNDQIEDTKEGFLVELDKDLGNYLRLGVGYNFTDYDDDLRDQDNWDSKGWFVKFSGKY